MKQNQRIDALNRLLAIHLRSLPSYLRDATPWSVPGDNSAQEVLNSIGEDQQQIVERVSDLLKAEKADIFFGEYPMFYTGLHDLSLDYIVGELVTSQKQTVQSIESCAEDLAEFPLEHSLAKESLGMAKGHLDSLTELTSSNA